MQIARGPGQVEVGVHSQAQWGRTHLTCHPMIVIIVSITMICCILGDLSYVSSHDFHRRHHNFRCISGITGGEDHALVSSLKSRFARAEHQTFRLSDNQPVFVF